MALAVDLTPLNFFTRAGFHPLWTAGIVAAGAWYVLAVRRLRAAGGTWPAYRIWLFAGALVAVAAGALSGLTWWNESNFTLPTIRRVLIGMVAPIPLVLSAPLHLILETGSARTRRLLGAALDSRAARGLTNPVTTWLIYGAWICTVYFTPLYRVGTRHAAVGGLIDLAFLVVGILFYTPAFGEDLPPRRMPPLARLLYFLVGLPYYTVVGMALESQDKPNAPGLSINDVHTGGGVLWSAGEIIVILSTVAMLLAWLRVEERSAQRRDRTDEAAAQAQAEAWRAERRLAAAHAAAVRAGLLADPTATGLDHPR